MGFARAHPSYTLATMLDVVNLALPFFGLIFLGYACCRLRCSIDPCFRRMG
jgi:hypothetical protein